MLSARIAVSEAKKDMKLSRVIETFFLKLSVSGDVFWKVATYIPRARILDRVNLFRRSRKHCITL